MAEHILNDEARYTILRHLADDPNVSQRELAAALGISLGKVNYCLNALLDKGFVKAVNFKNSQHKSAYLYLLTPAGIAAKAQATARFLARKEAEYERLAAEIQALRREVRASTSEDHAGAKAP